MNKRILIAVGGTAGHVHPALAFAAQLKNRHEETSLFFAGGGLHTNRYFDRALYPFEEISCGYFPFNHPLTCLLSLAKNMRGILQSIFFIRRVKPHAVVGFGSYHSFPVMVAARLLRVPYLLHESNSIPGKVNRLLSKSAIVTGIQFPLTARYLKGRTHQVEMPLHRNTYSTDASYSHYGLDPTRCTLLVFGGSQGAAALNALIPSLFLTGEIDSSDLQVIHFTGKEERVADVKGQYEKQGVTAFVGAYESQMQRAWEIATVVISRSGAGTIAEQIEYEVPGILIPFPFASDNHQEKNADFMVDTVQGADKILEADVTPSLLAKTLGSFLAHKSKRLKEMRENIQRYKKETKVSTLCSILEEELLKMS